MKDLGIKTIILALQLSLSGAAFASGPGTTAANFLKLGAGTRPVGMGGAFTAVADDVNALYWNPAGLAGYEGAQASLMHNEMGEAMRLESAAFSVPVRPLKGALAGGFTLFTINDIQGYDAVGAKTASLDASDREYSIGYGAEVLTDLSAGAAFKAINERLDTYSASAYAMDAGVLYRFSKLSSPFLSRFSLAMALQNIGTGMKFIEESAALPSNFVAAIAYSGLVCDNRLVVDADFNSPSDNGSYVNAGAEYFINDIIALRCGYQSRDDIGGGLRAGVGLRIRNVDMDYGFVPRGDFGSSHRVSLTFRFGKRYDEALAFKKIEQQFERGVKYYNGGDLVDAHREFRNVVLVAPGHEKAKEYLARTEIRIDEIQDKSNMEKHLAAGKELFEARRLGDAQAEFDSVLAIDPGNKKAVDYVVKIRASIQSLAESLCNRGQKYYDAGEYEQALESMNKVLVIDPENQKAKEYLALAGEKLKKMEQLKLGRQDEEKRIKAKRYAAAAFEEGMAFYEQKKWKNAVRKFNEALSLDPDDAKTGSYLAKAGEMAAAGYVDGGRKAYERNDLKEAQRQFESAVSYDPHSAEAVGLLSEVKGKIAKENKEKAFEYNKEALAAYSAGNEKLAVEMWRKALELDPGLEEAQKSLTRVEQGNKK